MPARGLVLVLLALGLLGLAPSARAAETLYVGNVLASDVSAFSVGSDGALSPVAGSPFAADDGPAGAAMTPNGGLLYTGDSYGYKGLMHVSAFSVGSDGALTPVSGSPFSAGDGPVGLAVTPDGGYLYVANYNSEYVSAFSISPDGTPTPVPGSPFSIGVEGVAETWGNGVAVTPDGDHLYVSGGPHYLWEFSIGAEGALTPVPGSPLTIGNDPGSVEVTPDGEHLYVANYGTDDVSAFSIGLDGALTPVAGSPFSTGQGPGGAAVTPDGEHLYVTNYNAEDMSAFSIAPDGTLSPVPGSPFAVGEYPNGVAVSPDGAHLYVPEDGSNQILAFSISSDGAPTPVPGSPFAAGADPAAMVVSPDQGPVAAFSASAAPTGSPSTFDGSGSTDPDGTVVRYDWSFGDRTSAPDAGPQPTHTYATPGDYTVTLTVTDDADCSTAQTYTGQTVSCNGSSAARVSHRLTVPGGPPSSPPSSSSSSTPPSSSATLRGLKVSPASFSSAGRRVGRRCVKATGRDARRPPCTREAKLTVSYTLSASASVTFKITGALPGRKVGHRCVARTPANAAHERCIRRITVHGSMTQKGKAGANRLVLARKLAPGGYTLTATPAGGAAEHVTFRIVG
ncbi:MAG TPA: beta-propeller fold lactonase family protein [Solirubrobacterales bacterium]|nr:beta-propeller fold lactonase family protein [Solirubrobacterales bacterium]